MMKLFVLSLSAFLMSLSLALVAGCLGHGSASAASGAWEPFLVLKAPNASADLALVQRLRIRHELSLNLWGDAYAAGAQTSACPGIGTVTPPSESDTDYHATSCSGVLYSLVPCPDSSGPCVIDGLPSGQAVLFDAPNCQTASSGEVGFVSPTFTINGHASLSPVSISPGLLFRYDPAGTGASDPKTYLMLQPGGGVEQSVTVQSAYVFGTGCQPVSPVSVQAFSLAPNSGTVTSMASAAVPAPVSIGTP